MGGPGAGPVEGERFDRARRETHVERSQAPRLRKVREEVRTGTDVAEAFALDGWLMYARAVDEMELRLRELRHEQWLDLALAAVVFGLALVATQARPSLVMPLFLGGVFAWALGIRALYRHWDLLDRLADERDALVIPEVASYASRHATGERRHGSPPRDDT